MLDQDYQSDTAGGLPTDGTTFVGGGGASLTIVTGANDVFGGGANQSLKFDVPNTSSAIFYAVNDVPQASGLTASGVFSTKFYHSSTGTVGTPFTELKLGAKDAGSFMSASNIGVYLGINSDANVLIFTSGGTVTTPTDQAISFDAAHDIEVAMDVVAGTYTLKVDGTTFTTGAGAQSVFNFDNAVGAVNALELSTPTSSRTGTVFLDDVLIDVPEPGSMSLVVAGALLLLRRKREAA